MCACAFLESRESLCALCPQPGLWLADKACCPIQAMHFKSQLQHPVKWWRYSHESRLVLLGTGELGLWLQVGRLCTCASPLMQEGS